MATTLPHVNVNVTAPLSTPFSFSSIAHPLLRIGATGVIATTLTTLTVGAGLLVGACAEVAAAVTEYAIKTFVTINAATIRLATRGARLLGGFYLGNFVLQNGALGVAPMAFGATTVLLTLGSVAMLHLFISTINDLLNATSGMRINSPTA